MQTKNQYSFKELGIIEEFLTALKSKHSLFRTLWKKHYFLEPLLSGERVTFKNNAQSFDFCLDDQRLLQIFLLVLKSTASTIIKPLWEGSERLQQLVYTNLNQEFLEAVLKNFSITPELKVIVSEFVDKVNNVELLNKVLADKERRYNAPLRKLLEDRIAALETIRNSSFQFNSNPVPSFSEVVIPTTIGPPLEANNRSYKRPASETLEQPVHKKQKTTEKSDSITNQTTEDSTNQDWEDPFGIYGYESFQDAFFNSTNENYESEANKTPAEENGSTLYYEFSTESWYYG